MKYTEITGDLFPEENMNSDTFFTQCISADFGMGKGIAVEFNKRFDTKDKLKRFYPNYLSYYDAQADKGILGSCIIENRVLNLVTKRNYWGKPNYRSLTDALSDMKYICKNHNIKKVAMPQIGCGLDRLEWGKVSEIIRQVFEDTDIEITVCKLGGKIIAPDEKAAASMQEMSRTLKDAGYKVANYEDVKGNPGRFKPQI